jgi:hypothetical protein
MFFFERGKEETWVSFCIKLFVLLSMSMMRSFFFSLFLSSFVLILLFLVLVFSYRLRIRATVLCRTIFLWFVLCFHRKICEKFVNIQIRILYTRGTKFSLLFYDDFFSTLLDLNFTWVERFFSINSSKKKSSWASSSSFVLSFSRVMSISCVHVWFFPSFAMMMIRVTLFQWSIHTYCTFESWAEYSQDVNVFPIKRGFWSFQKRNLRKKQKVKRRRKWNS